jgi:hypothetical protein
MRKIHVWLLCAILLACGHAEAAKFISGQRGALVTDSCILTSTCGATLDLGEVDDPTTQAVAYSGAVPYPEGAIVLNAGTYYYSKAASNLNNSLANTTWWKPLSTFYYVSGTGSDSGTCTGNTDPALAKAAPCTMLRVYDYLNANNAGITAPDGSMVLFNRGATHQGTLTVNNAGGQQYIIGAYGAGARPVLQFLNNTASAFTGSVVDFQKAGHTLRNVTLDARYVTDYPVSGVVGTFADGDVVSKQSDGTVVATIVGSQNGTLISVIHSSLNGFYSTSDVIQTAGGAKQATITSGGNSRTAVNCLSVTAADIRAINVELKNAEGNGISLGQNALPGSADRFYLYNSSIHDVIKWGGNGGGIQGGWGTGQKILWSTFYDNGATTGSHNVYLEDLDHLEFGNNYSYMTNTSTKGNHCLVVHGAITVADVHDNEFKRCRNGVGFNDGYFAASTEYMDQISFYRNLIHDMGLENVTTDGLILDLSCLTNSYVYNNIAFNNVGIVSVNDFSHTGAPNHPTNTVLFAYNTWISDTNIGNGNYFVVVRGASTLAVTFTNNIMVSKRSTLETFSRDTTVTDATVISLTYNDIFNTTGRANVIRWAGTGYSTSGFSGATSGNGTNTGSDPGFVTSVTTGSTESALSGLLLNVSSFARNVGNPNGTVIQDVYRRSRNAVNPSVGFFELLH